MGKRKARFVLHYAFVACVCCWTLARLSIACGRVITKAKAALLALVALKQCSFGDEDCEIALQLALVDVADEGNFTRNIAASLLHFSTAHGRSCPSSLKPLPPLIIQLSHVLRKGGTIRRSIIVPVVGSCHEQAAILRVARCALLAAAPGLANSGCGSSEKDALYVVWVEPKLDSKGGAS